MDNAIAAARTLRDEDTLGRWTRGAKVQALRLRRLVGWVIASERWPEPVRLASAEGFPHLHYARSLPIARTDDAKHEVLEAGKRENLARAVTAFDGLVLSPEHPLSFWRTLGRLQRSAGYRHGMELSGGCIVPAVGGGVCLIANVLFEMAVYLGWRVIERHGHSMEAIPPRPGETWGLDATVFWPYVDLRVAPREGTVRLGLELADAGLLLSLRGAERLRTRSLLDSVGDRVERVSGLTFRANRIRRRVYDVETDLLVADEMIAENRRRVLSAGEQGRNCLTCHEMQCRSRVVVPGQP